MTTLRTTNLGCGLCLGGTALGFIGLIGWLTGSETLTMIAPGQPLMMPNTAVALLLLGAVGVLRGYRPPAVSLRSLSALMAIIVLAVGLVTLAEYAVDLPFSIDQLLFRIEAGPYPGRPSPPTALALVLLALATLLWDWRPSDRVPPAEGLILFAGLIAFTAILGQVFGVGALYRFIRTPIVGVAVHTALGLLLISVGLLLERPGSRIARIASSPNPGDMMLRRLALAFVLMAVSIGFAGALLSEILGSENAAVIAAILTVIGIVLGLSLLAITARQLNHAHEALARSQTRTRELVEHASDGIFIADLDGRYVEVNEAGCRMLGYDHGELIGKTIIDLIPPEDEERLWQDRERFLQGATNVGEWMLLKKDGTYLTVEVSAKILADGRWQGIVRDISERKRAEKALRQAQERLDLALRGAALATWDWNVATGEVIFNQRWAELRGYHPQEISPRVDSWSKGIHPDDWPTVQNRVQGCFEGRDTEFECEYRVAIKSGEWIWVLDRGKVFERDEQGRPTRMVGIELDVTARKRAEEALRLSEAKFSGIVSISADAIISIDEDQKITLFNEGAEKIFGWSNAEVIGRPLSMLIPGRFRAVHARHVETFAAEAGTARRMGACGAAIFGVRKNGKEFPADAAISAFVVGGRRILTVDLRDITELKEAEAAAKRATQARDDLLGIVAHDLRNPLAAIASLASVLKMREAEGEIAEEISTAANRMNRLIGDLLDVTRMEAGHLSLKQERLPAAEVIADAMEGQAPLTSSASLELRLETAPELPDVWADRDRLLQVFENLIGNAIKFTKPGGRITLGAIVRQAEVIFSVSDTGCGIAETHLPHVFDRFWQAPGTERGGMGFGLAIVKGIVEAHGGRIWVQSAPGQGSTFFFTIPTTAEQTAARHAAQ